MEQQNTTAALNDTAGVLPMDTGVVTVNGIHGKENLAFFILQKNR
jgi:hypothetical protein